MTFTGMAYRRSRVQWAQRWRFGTMVHSTVELAPWWASQLGLGDFVVHEREHGNLNSVCTANLLWPLRLYKAHVVRSSQSAAEQQLQQRSIVCC